MSEKTDVELAVEHSEWTSEFFKWVYVQAFIHGYKHGKEAKAGEK